MENTNPKPKYRRKQYIVSKAFQLRYVGVILLLMFLTGALCAYVVYYTSMIHLGEKLASVYPQGRLISIVNMVNSRILLSLILVTPMVALMGIFLSHKIAGPLFRIERTIRNITNGDLSEHIVLRKGDELSSLADVVNDLSERFKEDASGKKARLDALLAKLNSLQSKADDPQAVNAHALEIKKEIMAMTEEFEKHKV